MVLDDDCSTWKTLKAADEMPFDNAQSDKLGSSWTVRDLDDPDGDSFLGRIEGKNVLLLFQFA